MQLYGLSYASRRTNSQNSHAKNLPHCQRIYCEKMQKKNSHTGYVLT